MDLYAFDACRREGLTGPLCGIDEAGRGPLAGPVFAAAVILRPEPVIEGLNDSKKLTAKRREALYEIITRQAAAYAIAYVDAETIDRVNILQATFLAMRQAMADLPQPPALALVDGNRDPGLGVPTELIVGGDGQSASIAAASILAKVARDRTMLRLAEAYPEYRFDKHKGYGTPLHYELLRTYGVSPIHRKSFLRKMQPAPPALGPMGERYTAGYLEKAGYTILAHNYRSRYGEIDLIACDSNHLLFVEVKTRTEHAMVEGRQAVDRRKQTRILRTALQYLSEHPDTRQPRFDVAEVVASREGDRVIGFTYLDNAFGMEGYHATF